MNLVSAIFPLLTVIIGGICALILINTKTLRDSRDDFAVRIKQLEDERTRDKEALAESATAIRFWRSAATGDEKLDAVTSLLTVHHDESQKNWVLVNAGLGHIGTSIDRLIETLEGNA